MSPRHADSQFLVQRVPVLMQELEDTAEISVAKDWVTTAGLLGAMPSISSQDQGSIVDFYTFALIVPAALQAYADG